MRTRWGVFVALGFILRTAGPASSANPPSATSWDQTFHWSRDQVELTTDRAGVTRINIAGADWLRQAGEPLLPWIRATVEVPDGYDVGSWSWSPDAKTTLGDGITLGYAAEDRPGSEGGPVAAPAQLEPVWPRTDARFSGVGTQRGITRATFLVAPIRWTPSGGHLELIDGGTLHVTFVPAARPRDLVKPERALAGDTALDRESIPFRRDALHPRGAGRTSQSSRGGSAVIATSPSLEGGEVKYLIITNDALFESFVPLCDWKNETGRSSTIRTVEWIYQNYPQGVDNAEKVRLFLRDAYRLWGTETVILGGDPSIIPIRYAQSWAWDPLHGGRSIATDYYYACLDGNWNANQNAVFGEGLRFGYNEVSDEIDMLPEIMVGRIPVRTKTQADAYFAKYFKYVKNPVIGDYLRSVAVLGEVLFDDGWVLGDCDTCPGCSPTKKCVTNDGAVDCFPMIDSLSNSPRGDFFQITEYYERDYWWKTRNRPNALPLSGAALTARLNQGVAVVFHVGHGNQDRWAIGPDRYTVTNFMALQNGDRVSGMAYTIDCNSAAVDFDCAAEGWLNAPNGGGLIYIGSTNLDFPLTAASLREEFFHLWPGDGLGTPGEAFFGTARHFEPDLDNGLDSTLRFMMYGLIFLGDPELHLYSTIPAPLNANFPAGVQLGRESTPVEVTLNGAAVEGAEVTIYKVGDAVASGVTGSDGRVALPFHPASTGNFKVTVIHPDGVPFVDSGVVNPTSSTLLTLGGLTVADSPAGPVIGNGNGKLELGETAALNLTVLNRGGAAASNGTATLRVLTAPSGIGVTLDQSEATLPAVPANGLATVQGAFRLTTTETGLARRDPLQDLVQISLAIDFVSGATTRTENTTIWLHRPDLVLVKGTPVDETNGDGVPAVNENWNWSFEFLNRGSGDLSHARARFQPSVNQFVEFRRDTTSLAPAVNGAHTSTANPFAFTIKSTNNLFFTLVVEDTLTTPPRVLFRRTIDFSAPTRPEQITATGSQHNIRLEWSKPASTRDLWGYLIERGPAMDGPFESLGQGFVENEFFYVDENLPVLTSFFYRIAAVDSSGNTTAYSEVGEGKTSAGSLGGWPFTLNEEPDKFGAPAIENIDNTGAYETFLPGDVLYVVEPNASDYIDGDQIPLTQGLFFEPKGPGGYRVKSKPAIADLNPIVGGFNRPEVILIVENKYDGGSPAGPPSAIEVFDYQGILLWKKEITGASLRGSPAVGDLDGDGKPEIVFLGGSKVFAFHGDGRPVGTAVTGVLRDMGSTSFNFIYASPAIGDVIGDSKPEIVFVARGASDSSPTKLFILDASGHDVQNFPLTFSEYVSEGMSTNASAALADVDQAGAEPKLEIFVNTRARMWCIDPDQSDRLQRVRWSRVSSKTPGSVDGQPVGSIELNGSPAIGDLNGDGSLEVVYGWSAGRLYVRDAATGAPFPGFFNGATDWVNLAPTTNQLGSPVLGDLTGDGQPDIIVGDDKGSLWGVASTGATIPGFPIRTPGLIGPGVAIWDIDKDSHPNVIVCGQNSPDVLALDFPNATYSGNFEDLKSVFPWPVFRHDAWNSGVALSEIVTPIGLAAPELVAQGLEVSLSWSTDLACALFRLERRAADDTQWTSVAELRPSDVLVGRGLYRTQDLAPAEGYWAYRVIAIDESGGSTVSSESSITLSSAPLEFRLSPARPNPTTGVTRVELELPRQVETTVRLLDASGRTRALLFQGAPQAGRHTFVFSGRDTAGHLLPGGVYFVEARTASGEVKTERLVLVR